jgi:hypothetical protein
MALSPRLHCQDCGADFICPNCGRRADDDSAIQEQFNTTHPTPYQHKFDDDHNVEVPAEFLPSTTAHAAFDPVLLTDLALDQQACSDMKLPPYIVLYLLDASGLLGPSRS